MLASRRRRVAVAGGRRVGSSGPFVLAVERGEDARGKRGRAPPIDELQHRVHVRSLVCHEGSGEPGVEAGLLEPSAAPRNHADPSAVDARRM
jgi:hypothetical protein